MYEHLYIPRPVPPVKIAAIQWTGKNHQQVTTFLGDIPHTYKYPGGTISIKGQHTLCGWDVVYGTDYIMYSEGKIVIMKESDFNKEFVLTD